MNKLKKIQMKETDYYFGNDIAQLNLPGLKKYTNGRRLVEDQGISNKHYMFVRHDGDSWIKSSDKSCKFDKIIIKADYVEKHIFPKKMKPNKDDDDEEDDEEDDEDNEEEENEITIAPGIIKLSKKEKMKDNSGNIIEIEVRGTRDHDNCYFRVSDVSVGFGMKELYRTITHKNNNYCENTHYRYLYFKKTTKKGYCRKLFLTLIGMEKVINCSRSIHIQNAMIARKWLSQFSVSIKFNSLVLDSSKSSTSNIGYVYCITSEKIDANKIGYWKGTKKDLISRYKTYYGDSVELFCVKTMYPELLEKKCHQHFVNYKLSHELYDKSNTDKYKLYLKENKITPTEQDIYEDQQITKTDVKTLFTTHLTTQDQKNKLSSKLMRIPTNIISVDKIKELENEIKELKYQNEINELKYKNIILEKDLEISNLNKKLKKKK
ncbi:hypothetical protein qu_977 [Acanthamoeba polyphaga mimivirus]|nr:hypothetical protein [Mimivirus reunion]WMV61343.1 hypothetical protein qu_5 [Mimivirus sp.]WMV62320.1 hypothetical protein qu_5 [Acanthamoeba polyphaga mimivirus]QTF49868.1 hypothetical protein [Mimivirus reunion]WMV62311.1 hypothetical protein qu_977 [Mimivirus sp.]